MPFKEMLSSATEEVIANVLIFASFVVPFFIIFWVVFRKKFQKIRIQEVQRATSHHFKHDISHTLTSLLIFAAMDLCLLYLQSKGYTFLYSDASKYGWIYMILSFAIVVFLNDTYFYWTHRAMHHPKLYKFFHRVHHESTDPSPLTSGAFHPSEAVVENTMHFILPFLMPLHIGVVLTWQLFDMLNNVMGHLGYELYPKGWVKNPILKFKTTSTHHNMHHQHFNGNYALYFTWWDKWMGTEFSDYEARHEAIFERKPLATTPEGRYKLILSFIRNETPDTYTIGFQDPPAEFQYFSAGKHVTISVPIDGKIYHRTFSISSVPVVDKTMTLTIKKIKGGKVTNYLAENIRPGDELEISAPAGQFFVEPEPANQKHYLMIAGGSGITPIFSMIGSILHLEPHSRISLLYANRRSVDVVFREKLEQWKLTHPATLDIKYFLSEEDDPGRSVRGYITRVSLESTIHEHGIAKTEAYLCGPEAMTEKMQEELINLGLPAEKIHRELFYKPQQTAISEGQEAIAIANLHGRSFQFRIHKKKTILQSGLAEGVPLPYSCTSGLCGTCKMKCTSGKFTIQNNQVLSDQELHEGYILTCQSYPLTKEITIQTL